MGQMAEDVLDGSMCSLCGCYFDAGKPQKKAVLHHEPVTIGEQEVIVGKISEQEYSGGIYCHGHPVVCWDCWGGLSKVDRKQYQRAEVATL